MFTGEAGASARGILFGIGTSLITQKVLQGESIGLGLLSACGGLAAYSIYSCIKNRRLVTVHLPGAFLGTTFMIGAAVAQNHPEHWRFGAYMMVLSFFHASEYFTTALFNPEVVTFDSWLLNHSKAYGIAAAVSWLEYGIEATYFPALKLDYLSYFGLCLSLVGELFRKAAMWTARSNFKHIIAEEKEDSHKLVTHGIYQFSRHPSYFGFFYWSIGTQVLLSNPICIIAYALASHSFFKDRIPYEERLLCEFFEDDYVTYQHNVGIGIPFITAYKPSDYEKQWWKSRRNVAAAEETQ